MSLPVFGRQLEYTVPIIYSVLFWTVLQLISFYLTPRIFGKYYSALDERRRAQWHVRSVSVVHAIVSVCLALPLLFDEELRSDMIFGFSDYAAWVHTIPCGYFIWDTIVCIYYIQDSGIGFVIHGIVSFLVFYLAYRPFLIPFGAVFLMFELSTPFLHFNWFLDKCNLTGTTLQLLNFMLLGLSYAGVRITFGLYSSFFFFTSMWEHLDEVPLPLAIFYSISNILLNGLNLYWLLLMVPSMMGRFGGPKEKKKEGKAHQNGHSNSAADQPGVPDQQNGKKQMK